MPTVSTRTYSAIFLVILIGATALRCVGLEKGIWLDEGSSLAWLHASSRSEMLRIFQMDQHPPLYFVLCRLWMVLGNSDRVIRLFSVLISLLFLITVHHWLKKHSRLGAMLAVIYLATTPLMLRYSQEIRPYGLLLLFAAASLWSIDRLLKSPLEWRGYLELGASLSAMVLVNVPAVMMIPALLGYLIVTTRLNGIAIHWWRLTGILLLPIACFCSIFFFLFLVHPTAADWWMPPVSFHSSAATLEYMFGAISLDGEFHPTSAMISLAIVFMAVMFGERSVVLTPTVLSCLPAAFVFTAELLIYSWLKLPIFYYRTLLPALIPIVGAVALQVATIRRNSLRLIASVLFGVLSLNFSARWIEHEAYVPIEANFPVARAIQADYREGDRIAYFPPYVKDSIEHYLFWLPENDRQANALIATAVENGQDELIKRAIATSTADGPLTFRLVTRVDLSASLNDFRELITSIRANPHRPINVVIYQIVSHDFLFVPDQAKPQQFLNVAESLLGHYSGREELTGYTITKYPYTE